MRTRDLAESWASCVVAVQDRQGDSGDEGDFNAPGRAWQESNERAARIAAERERLVAKVRACFMRACFEAHGRSTLMRACMHRGS